MSLRQRLGRYRRYLQDQVAPYRRTLGIALDKAVARFRQANVAIFHEFRPPPERGGIGSAARLDYCFPYCGDRTVTPLGVNRC